MICLYGFSQSEPTHPEPSGNIIISPNPVTAHFFTVEVDSSTYDHFERLVIYSSNGFVMMNRELRIFKGTTREQIDISSYYPGNYFVRIMDVKNPFFSFSTHLLVQ
jgi:Secretion system C-terminal sorting domain